MVCPVRAEGGFVMVGETVWNTLKGGRTEKKQGETTASRGGCLKRVVGLGPPSELCRDPQNWYFWIIWLILPPFLELAPWPDKARQNNMEYSMEYQYNSFIIWGKTHVICVDLNKLYHLRIWKIVKNKWF